MELLIDDSLDDEIKDFLLSLDGVVKVDLNREDYISRLNIDFNNKTNHIIIMKFIELFQKYNYSQLLEFDKGYGGNYKVLKYTINDMCCEYCYKGLVMDLFENNMIKSVKSNFEFNKPVYNIEFIIEYKSEYDEKELIGYINEKYI